MKRNLRKLAKLHGVSTSYRDMNGNIILAKSQTVTRLLESILDVDLSTNAQIKAALKNREDEIAGQIVPPVLVAWNGKLEHVLATLKSDELSKIVEFSIQVNGKAIKNKTHPIKARKFQRGPEILVRVKLPVTLKLPYGYFPLEIKVAGRPQKILVISAPKTMHEEKGSKRKIGLFTPLYALRSETNCGAGDLGDLKKLMAWVGKQGGHFVATLPLLASDYSKRIIDPSPYSGISRLFLNEIYIDIGNHDASSKILRDLEFVDYKKVYALKKQKLLELSDQFFLGQMHLSKDFKRFLIEVPDIKQYARYRSRLKRQQDFHVFCQFRMHQQLKHLRQINLFLDLPIGVARKSYDGHQYPSSFLKDVSAGAPPDKLFRSGQNWGFFPLHPKTHRTDGYAYFRRVLERQFAYAQILRIDHIAGLHRLFAIPDGTPSDQGTYIRYQSDELYAILLLEAHRRKALVVGEDLGVVPSTVRDKMAKHGISGMWVYEFAADDSPSKALQKIPKNNLRLIDTHDTPPLFGFSQGLDISFLRQRGFIGEQEEMAKIRERTHFLQRWSRYLLKKHQHSYIDNEFLELLLKKISANPRSFTQINLEDLWLESDPQNIPGTSNEYPNWKNKHRYSMEEWMKSAPIKALIRSLTHER